MDILPTKNVQAVVDQYSSGGQGSAVLRCNYNIDPARSLPARIKFLKLGKCYSGVALL